MALDALLDPDIDLVILTGAAGSGKTLLAMAAALEQTVERKMFDKIIVTRNTPDIGESIGFLPGTEEEKMMPWLASVTDTLEALHKMITVPMARSNTSAIKPTFSLNRSTLCAVVQSKTPSCCSMSVKTSPPRRSKPSSPAVVKAPRLSAQVT